MYPFSALEKALPVDCRQNYFPEISQFLSRTEFEVPSEITHAEDIRAQQGWSESDVTGLE